MAARARLRTRDATHPLPPQTRKHYDVDPTTLLPRNCSLVATYTFAVDYTGKRDPGKAKQQHNCFRIILNVTAGSGANRATHMLRDSRRVTAPNTHSTCMRPHTR